MKVIFGKDSAELADERLTVLELDTFFQAGLEEPVTAYAVMDTSSVGIHQFPTLQSFRDLHNQMLEEYRKQNFKYCEDALEHLTGQWAGELDSFYEEFGQRIQSLKDQKLKKDWTGIVINTIA